METIFLDSSQFDTLINAISFYQDSLTYLQNLVQLLLIGIAAGISIIIVYMFYSIFKSFL